MSGRSAPVRSHDLLVLGELNADVVADCGDTLPVFGQREQLIEQAALTLGSSGAITASAAAALGLRVAYAGVVGDDALGTYVLETLAASGVDVSACLRRPARQTGMTLVLSRHGDRSMLTFPGTMADLSVRDVPEALLTAARHVHVSSYFLQDGLRPGLPALFAQLADAGVSTSLDPGWDPAEQWDSGLPAALRAVRWFLPNEQELHHIATALTGGTDDPLGAVTALGTGVAVKLGATGAAVRDRDTGAPSGAPAGDEDGRSGRVTATPVAPVDTTGAGDNFNAGFLAGLLAGEPPRDALALAAACGSVSVLGFGGTGRHATAPEAAARAAELPRTAL